MLRSVDRKLVTDVSKHAVGLTFFEDQRVLVLDCLALEVRTDGLS